MSVEVCQQELWSVPMQKSGGTTAVKLGSPEFTKADRAAGRCFSKLSLVYKGTQLVSALNWSGGHSARGPPPGGWATNDLLSPQVVPIPRLPLGARTAQRC